MIIFESTLTTNIFHHVIFSKLFGKESDYGDTPKTGVQYKLQDISFNKLGIEGEEELMAMAKKKDYKGMKFKSLELYNKAYDKYLETNSDEVLNLMYAAMKNLEACQLMWHYHDQILGLSFGDAPERFDVQLDSTIPFEFPESRFYHEKAIPPGGTLIPFIQTP
jgi:hypothetical protein